MAEEFNHFPQTAAALHRALSRTVRKVALDIQKDAIDLAPVDTGFLRASIYTITSTKSTYGQGRVSAHGGTRNVAKALYQELLPEVDPPENDLTAIVAVGASYGEYVELGTRFMPPQPYFYQAVEWGSADLDSVLRLIESQVQADLSGSVEASEE